MKYVLGIDGGGTKTLLVAENLQGQELFRLYGKGINLNSVPVEVVLQEVSRLLVQAAGEAGDEAELGAVCIGAAGISNPVAKETLLAGVRAAGFHGPVEITGDHFTALTGALGEMEGLLLISGTGSICVGVSGARQARAGGWGHLIDDEGSGYAIGRDIIAAVVQAEDGRRAPTLFREKLFQQLGIQSMQQLIGFVYTPGLAKHEIARLAPLLPVCFEAEDAAAREIVEKAAGKLVKLPQAVLRKLDLQEAKLALAGSILEKDPHVRQCFLELARLQLPWITVVNAEKNAASGAAILARNMLAGK